MSLSKLRKICLALPDAYELETWEIPTFRIGRKIFCFNSPQNGRDAIWFKVPAGVPQILIESDGGRFFRPPYLGHKGWVGMYLDKKPDWSEVKFMVDRSYTMIAPKRRPRARKSR
jgi:predicted DNA-binding protein (MmcQ/YjbR family)